MTNSISQINIEPQEVHFEMVGKQPTEQEADNLLKFPQRKKPISKEEIKDKMKTFASTAGGGIAIALGGGLLIIMGTGAEGAMKGLMYLAGIACGIIGAGVFILAFIAPFMSERKKTPDKSFLAWLSSILGEGQFFFKNNEGRNIEHRIYVLERMAPENIIVDKNETEKYITQIHRKITVAIDEITNKVCETYPKLKPAYTSKEIKIETVTMLFSNVAEICATINIEDILEEVISEIQKESNFHIAARVKLHIKQYMIKTENFWYPCDIMPEIRKVFIKSKNNS